MIEIIFQNIIAIIICVPFVFLAFLFLFDATLDGNFFCDECNVNPNRPSIYHTNVKNSLCPHCGKEMRREFGVE